MQGGRELKGQMLLDYKTRCTLPKYNISIIPTRIFEPPFGKHEKEIRHFADIPRLRALSERQSPFAPYIFIRDNGTAAGTGENESKVLSADAPTNKIIQTMEQIQDSSKGAQGVVLNPFAGQLLRDDGGIKTYAPIFGWIAYTREATARGNAVLEWTLGHPKGAVGNGDVQYCAFSPASMRQELRAVSQYPTQKPFALLDKGSGATLELQEIANGAFHSQNIKGTVWALPYLVQDAFQGLFPAILRLGGEPLYFEGATLFINGAWQHIVLQASHVKEKLAGLATGDFEFLKNKAHAVMNAPSMAGEVSGDMRKPLAFYAAAMDNPQVIGAGFDVAGNGSKTFSTLYYCFGKLSILQDIFDPDAMVAYADHEWHIDTIMTNLGREDFSFGAFFAVDGMKFEMSFRGHAHGYFSEKGLFGFCSTHERRSDFLQESIWARHFSALLPAEFRHVNNLKLKGRFRIEVDQSLPFAKVVVEEINGVERIAGKED